MSGASAERINFQLEQGRPAVAPGRDAASVGRLRLRRCVGSICGSRGEASRQYVETSGIKVVEGHRHCGQASLGRRQARALLAGARSRIRRADDDRPRGRCRHQHCRGPAGRPFSGTLANSALTLPAPSVRIRFRAGCELPGQMVDLNGRIEAFVSRVLSKLLAARRRRLDATSLIASAVRPTTHRSWCGG